MLRRTQPRRVTYERLLKRATALVPTAPRSFPVDMLVGFYFLWKRVPRHLCDNEDVIELYRQAAKVVEHCDNPEYLCFLTSYTKKVKCDEETVEILHEKMLEHVPRMSDDPFVLLNAVLSYNGKTSSMSDTNLKTVYDKAVTLVLRMGIEETREFLRQSAGFIGYKGFADVKYIKR